MGADNINTKFIYDFRCIIAPLLSYIFNNSVEVGTFPTALKIAKTIPIPKTNKDLDNPTNYRPISLLSIFSKIFEKLIANRLTQFFSKHKIFYDYQFGFRHNHSTKLALIDSVDLIRNNLDQNSIVAGIFLDLSKAFDSLTHDLLLKKTI